MSLQHWVVCNSLNNKLQLPFTYYMKLILNMHLSSVLTGEINVKNIRNMSMFKEINVYEI